MTMTNSVQLFYFILFAFLLVLLLLLWDILMWCVWRVMTAVTIFMNLMSCKEEKSILTLPFLPAVIGYWKRGEKGGQ